MLGYSVLLSIFLLFNVGQVLVGLNDGFPFDAPLLVYGIGPNDTKVGYNYCSNSSGCLQTICRSYQSNSIIQHIVVDPVTSDNSTCMPNVADTIMNNKCILATIIMMTLGGALALGRMIISITVRVGYRRLYFGLFLLERASILAAVSLSAYVSASLTVVAIALPSIVYDIRKIYFRMVVLRNKQLLETGL
jgi:hypothetical protein